MRSRKAYPLKLLSSIESEAEPAKLPLFEGKQLFCCLSLRVLGKCQQALGFYRKAKRKRSNHSSQRRVRGFRRSFKWKRAGEKT